MVFFCNRTVFFRNRRGCFCNRIVISRNCVEFVSNRMYSHRMAGTTCLGVASGRRAETMGIDASLVP